MQTSQGS